MPYAALSGDFNTMNDSQKNSAAIAAGYTGLNDYNDQVNRNKSGPNGNATPNYGNPSSNNFGFSNTQAPKFDLVAATEAAYNTPEILAANAAMDANNAKITERQKAAADAQAVINDNPFFSEATRVGKSQQLTQQSNADIGVLQNETSLAQGKVDRLKADAAIKVNAAQGQYNINRQEYQDSLNNFNNLLSNGALDGASGTDIANLAQQTGIPTSMIESMVQTSRNKNNPSSLVQSTDNDGNLTLLQVDSTGKVINTTVIAGAGKSVKATEDKNGDKNSTSANASQAAKSGATLQQLVQNYGVAGGLSVEEIYRIYNESGGPNGPARESLASVKEGRYFNVKNSGAKPANPANPD